MGGDPSPGHGGMKPTGGTKGEGAGGVPKYAKVGNNDELVENWGDIPSTRKHICRQRSMRGGAFCCLESSVPN